MGERARVRLIRASQSDELRATFRQLAEIDGPDGPKYPRRVLLELAARIVGRAHDPMLLELCHLVRAALLAGGGSPGGRIAGADGAGFEWIFWGVEEARAGAFRAAFFQPPGRFGRPGRSAPPSIPEDGPPTASGGALLVSNDAVTLVYSDARFEVRYGRMADLAAMMEFLVSTVGYRALVAALEPLAPPALDRDAVSGAARDLARQLYGWLGDHLPAAQVQRKFHTMLAFLEETRGGDFTEMDIDDETILRFWLRHVAYATDRAGGPGRAGVNFRGYRTTFLAFLSLSRVLAKGDAIGRFEQRIPVGPDVGAGEIDPAADAPAVEGAPPEDPLDRLQEEPAIAVKALNRRELALLQLPVGESDGVQRLPRSYLRAECFGPLQNRLSQALRRKAGAAELAAIIAAGPDPGYRSRVEALVKAEAHVRRVAKACLYVLHGFAGGSGGQGSTGRPGREAEGGDGLVRNLDFRILGEARKAFESLNRAGFERSATRDPDLAPAYRALAEGLPAVSEHLGAVLRALGLPTAWEAPEDEDRPIFSNAFARLYGAGTNEAAPGSADEGLRRGETGRAGGERRPRPGRPADENPVRPLGGRP